MQRYFLELSYKGTHYCGWQIQQNAITVQQKLNEALSTLCRTSTETLGCGRTDTGVHAIQFYAHFDTTSIIEDESKFLYQLNALLPHDIAIYNVIKVNADAHARFDATSRSYRYFISLLKDPFLRETAWTWRAMPDIKLMNDAAAMLPGTMDFTCFAKLGGQQENNICTVKNAEWIHNDHILEFRITANRFLRGMVRAIVGTLIDVGQNKLNANDFSELLKNGTRSDAGESVPAHGLFLSEIHYPFITPVQRNIILR